jgi:polyhydroxyalkanoate synthase
VEITFALTNRGHNVGVVSPPGMRERHYRIRAEGPSEPYRGPDAWLSAAPVKDGSWWPELAAWLAQRSCEMAAPPPMGKPDAGYPALGPAPGTYIFER